MSKRAVKVAVISDVHLGFLGCKAKELNKYLKSIKPEILVINGDFVDIWQFRPYYFPKAHAKVIQRSFKLVADGTKIYLLTGNHDEALRNYSGMSLGNIELGRQADLFKLPERSQNEGVAARDCCFER